MGSPTHLTPNPLNLLPSLLCCSFFIRPARSAPDPMQQCVQVQLWSSVVFGLAIPLLLLWAIERRGRAKFAAHRRAERRQLRLSESAEAER